MVIRGSQFDTFSRSAREQYEAELLEHMHQFEPNLCRLRGDEVVRDVIRSGIARAEAIGFNTHGPVQLFVELMFVHGYGFDTDPQLGWVQTALKSAPRFDQELRATRLHIASTEHLNRVVGPDRAYAYAALEKWNSLRSFPVEGQQTEAKILKATQIVYPQIWEVVGENPLRQVIRKASMTAREHQLPADQGITVLSGLMFGFGHEIVSDPLYPWVSATLSAQRYPDRSQCVAKLYEKTKLYVSEIPRTPL